jgi:TetR/AcrR family transcriptional repressor of nem operon
MSQNATQKKIIRTAEQLLWALGYEGASLNDIVAKAGISKGGLFHYYPNKRAVTQAVLTKYFDEQILDPLDRHLADVYDARSLKAGLMEWLREVYGAYGQKGFKGGCMLGNFALEVSDQDEALREAVRAMFLQWENRLVTALRPVAQNDGLIMDARQFARLLIAMYQGVTMNCKVNRDQIRASRDFQAMGEFIERSIVE